MPLELPVAALLVALLLTLMLFRVRAQTRAHEHTAKLKRERLDTVIGWPAEATRVFTAAELKSYDLLCKALPGHLILAQVPLNRFLRVPTRNSYAEWVRRAGQQTVDLVVCDLKGQVLAAVDIHLPKERMSERSIKRHERVGRVLQAAGIKLHTWSANQLPTVEMVRRTMSELLESAPAPQLHQSPREALAQLLQQGDAIEREQDLEPPPSAWFDDMESGPTPLDQLPPDVDLSPRIRVTLH